MQYTLIFNFSFFQDVPATKPAKPTMRQSVLTRMSVRLSVIPQDIMNKLKRTPEVNYISDKVDEVALQYDIH